MLLPCLVKFLSGRRFRLGTIDEIDMSGLTDAQLDLAQVPNLTPTSDVTVHQLFKIVQLLSCVAQEVGMTNEEIEEALLI